MAPFRDLLTFLSAISQATFPEQARIFIFIFILQGMFCWCVSGETKWTILEGPLKRDTNPVAKSLPLCTQPMMDTLCAYAVA